MLKNTKLQSADKKKRDGTLKIAPGFIVMTCFTSDYLLKDADEWRDECWEMIKRRSDCIYDEIGWA